MSDDLSQQLLQMINDAEGKLRDRDDTIRRHRALYEFRHYHNDASSGLSLSQKRLVNQYSYQSNAPTNTVDLTVGIMSHNQLKFRAYTYEENRDTNPQAGRIERLLAGVVRMNSVEQEADLHHDVIHNASIDGGVGLRCVWIPCPDEQPAQEVNLSPFERMANKARSLVGGQPNQPETKPAYLKGNPIKIHVIKLSNLIYLPGGPKGRWLMIAYRAERTIADIRTEFADYRPEVVGMNNAAQTKAKFYDVWFWNDDCVWNACFADQQLLRCQQARGYDDLPYTIAFFRPNDSDDQSKLGNGALVTIEEDVRAVEDRMSHTMRMLDIWSNLPLFVKTRDGRPIDVDATYGNIVQLGLDESAGFINPGGEPPDHYRMLQDLRQSISDGSYPPVAYGGSTGDSGYGLSQLSGSGRIRLEQPKRQIELLWTVVLRKALCLFREFAPEKGIQVYGKYKGQSFVMNDLTGADTSGWFVDVELDPHFPQDEARMAALGNQALAMKGLSRRTVQERYYGVDDPDLENKRMLIEAFMQSPEMMATMLKEAAKEYGLEVPQMGQPGGSPPRQPISQPLMSNPEQGVQPLPLAGSPQTGGDEARLAAAIGGLNGG